MMVDMNTNAAGSDLLTTAEAAARLGVSRYTLRGWINHGALPAERIGQHRYVRLAEAERARAPVAKVAQQTGGGYSSAEAAYVDEINSQANLLASTMNDFQQLFAAPRIGEDDWTFQFAAVVVTWRVTEEDALAMTPPPVFAATHDSYLLSLRYLNMAGDEYIAGVDALDPARIEQGNGHLQRATAEMGTTTDLVNAVARERGEQ
jgi:excisionase family DNA binding protein